MNWNFEKYTLGSGEEIAGHKAMAMRALDAIDPLSPQNVNKMRSDGDTRAELGVFLKDHLRWCEEIGRCVVRRWGFDMYELRPYSYLLGLVEDFLKARVVWAQDQLERHPGVKGIAAYAKFCRQQDSAANARSMANSMKGRLSIEVGELDQAPWLLGTPVGVVDVDTGELLDNETFYQETLSYEEPHHLALPFKITKRTNGSPESVRFRTEYEYDERWDEFIDEIMDGDAEKAEFLQRALGYSTHGGNPEKATFVLWGPKRDNGKSTLMSAVKHTLGDYAGSIKPGEILVRRTENPQAANPGIAKLVGKRLVDVSEPPLGAELNSALIKQMASGVDEISARHLQKEEISFVPQFTLWMHCNALPIVRDPTAIDPQHMFVIEFTRSFDPDERDLGLAERFASPRGMHTILKWLLDGYQKYKERGLDAPASVIAASTNWLAVSKSWLDAFLSERCEIGTSLHCGTGEFAEAAKTFCEDRGEVFNRKMLKAALKSANIVEGRLNGGNRDRVYKGVALLPEGRDKTESVSVPDLSQAAPDLSQVAPEDAGKSPLIKLA